MPHTSLQEINTTAFHHNLQERQVFNQRTRTKYQKSKKGAKTLKPGLVNPSPPDAASAAPPEGSAQKPAVEQQRP